MFRLNRRNFIKVAASCGSILAGMGELSRVNALTGTLKLEEGGRDFSPDSGKERQAIPSACWQCVARDTILSYVEDGRLVKIEGNPASIRNRGKICAKGQAGINQVYDPDRVLYPMLRVGKRGEGKWKRISWDEALDLLVNGGDISGHSVKGLRNLLDEDHPEKFMFHYGRMIGSDSKIIKDNFLPAFGTNTIGNHTTICEGGKWVAQELIWGKHYDVNDVEHTNMILNFGCNFFETHTSHIQIAQRAINAMTERGVKLYTFDVRLSNTAAKSTEWIPIKPGSDLAVALAMCNVIMINELYDHDFIETWTTVTVEQLKEHLKRYTPEWAEQLSGVSASMIKSLAIEFANANPGTCISYRGPVAHYNGVEAERAFKMLDAICGYIDVKGGTCHGVEAKWKYPKVEPDKKPKQLNIIDGFPGDAAFPNHHVSHQVLKMIKDGRFGRPDIYMVYCYQPVYVNGECEENIQILKDEALVPFLVTVSPFYGETESLADLILPDVTYLERSSWDDMVCYDMIPEFYLRQPAVKPLGEARQFQDVAIELAKRLGLNLPFNSTEDFIKKSCEKSHVDYEYLKKHGVWHDPDEKPHYLSYTKTLTIEDYTGNNILFDSKTGVYWNWEKSKAGSIEEAVSKGYSDTENAYKGYIGQRIGDKVYAGFKPDKVNKSGKFEIYSELLKKKGFNPMPTWFPVPDIENKKDDELILSTFKVNVHTQSRTANNKWLSEINHDNSALINPITAGKRGIKNGDKIKIKSAVGEIIMKTRVTEGVVPDLIAISFHLGHWQYGRFASGRKSPFGADSDNDLKLKWWSEHGVNPNWLIRNRPDRIAGQWLMNDEIVTITKV
ncbi:MAG: molybdopterin-dependent oxidoreductase [Planctomycetota bacterium]